MKYAKTVTLKDNRQCLIKNAVSDDAQAVMDVFLLTHDQTDFLASYGDEGFFDVDFERRFLSAKEVSDKEVYLCSLIDGRMVGTASIDAVGRSRIQRFSADEQSPGVLTPGLCSCILSCFFKNQ